MRSLRERFLKEEGGFTLAEMLVTTTIMVVVLFALYGIFDMSIRVFSFGNEKMEAVENTRLGLEKMEREIRAAYPQSANDDTLLTTWTGTRIAFGNELGAGDGTVSPGEVISYYQSGDRLMRRQGDNSQAVVAPLPANGLRFGYCKSASDCPPATPITNEGEVEIVRVSLTVNVDGKEQTLTTDVDLRNH